MRSPANGNLTSSRSVGSVWTNAGSALAATILFTLIHGIMEMTVTSTSTNVISQ
jgi:hypothetical protein